MKIHRWWVGERGCCCAVGILGKIRHVCCTSSLVEGTFYRRLLSIRYRMRLYLAIKDIVSHTCLPTRPIHSVKEAKPLGSRYPGIPHMMHLKSSLAIGQITSSATVGCHDGLFEKSRGRVTWVEIDTSHGDRSIGSHPYFMAVWSHQKYFQQNGRCILSILGPSHYWSIYI